MVKKVLKCIVLIILVLGLFASSLSLIILVPVKYAVNPNSISKMITNMDIENLVAESPEFHETINKTLEPVLSETKKLGVDEQAIMKIVNSKELKGMMAGVTSNIIDYALTGKEHELISIDQIKDLVNDAIDDINNNTNYEISSKDKESILNVVTEEADAIEEVIPDTSIIENNLPNNSKEMLNSVRFIFSNKLVLYLSIGALISLIGIVILKWKEAKWVKCSAITILIAALSVLLSVIVLMVGSKMLFDNAYILTIINSASKYNLFLSLGVSIVMLITIIVYSIIHKKKIANTK